MHYVATMFMQVDWSHRSDYVLLRHGVTVSETEEALFDPERLVLEPDPASRSGRSVRVIGWIPAALGRAGHEVSERPGH